MRPRRLAPFLLLAAGCAAPRYLARVNGQEIAADDVQAEFEARHAGHKRFLAGEPDVRKFVLLIVDKTLLVQEGYRIGLQDRPEIRTAVEEYGRRQQVKRLLQVEVEDRSKPTEEEIRAVWEGRTEELVEVLQIVTETEAEAAEIRAQLEKGADFDQVARSRSVASSRKHGGRLPRLGWGAMDPAWEQVVSGLAEGQLSPVFEAPDGFQVVKLVARTKVEKPDYAKAQKRIGGVLTARKRKAAEEALRQELWRKYAVAIADFERSLPALRQAVADKRDSTIATWKAGTLGLAEFAGQLELDKLGELAPYLYRRQVDRLLDWTVEQKLFPLETAARGYGADPAIAEKARRFQDNLVEEALYAEYVLPDVKVGDQEVAAWYQAHQAEILTPEQRRVSHIVLASEAQATEVARKLAEGVPFPELVTAYSTDAATRKMAGDLGLVAKGRVPREFDPVFALQPGETTAPIQSQFGYHIFKVTAVLAPRPKTLAEAKDEIQKKLTHEKQMERRNHWLARLKESASIQVNDAGIHAFAAAQDAELARAAGAAPPSHMAPGSQ